MQEKVRKYAYAWQPYINLQLDFVNDPEAEFRISFDRNDGSWSYVGTQAYSLSASQATMNFGWLTPHTPDDELARVVIHEFGHALGCLHEHQNPEGGIQWNIPGVYIYNRSKQWSDSQIVQYSGSVGY